MICLGCLPDPEPTSVPSIDALKLGARVLPESVDHSHAVAQIFDQGSTNSCVGNAIAQAIDTWRVLHGLESIRLSRSMIYWVARHQSNRGQKRDEGTYIRAGIQAVIKHGVASEREWPFSPMRINDKPPWRVIRDAAPLRGARGFYRIYGGGDYALQELRAAVASKLIPVIGVQATETFRDARGEDPIPFSDGSRILGGHASAVVGYRPDAIKIANSWSTRWGFGGFGWLDNRWAEESFDRQVVNMEAA